MKPEELFDAMNGIDDEILERSERIGSNPGNTAGAKGRGKRIVRIAAVIAVAAVIVTVALILDPLQLRKNKNKPMNEQGVGTEDDGDPQKEPTKTPDTDEAEKYLSQYYLGRADYPQTVKVPRVEDYLDADGSINYTLYNDAFRKWSDAYREAAQSFSSSVRMKAKSGVVNLVQASLATMLAGEAGSNRVYSPANLYMALGMLAEITDGNTRAQVMKLLGASGIDELREMSDAAWKMMYRDDGTLTSIPAASLWLRDDDRYAYIPATIERLSKTYHSSTFRGVMGSAEYDKALQSWLNVQTDGLLRDSVAKQTLDPGLALALATTLNYSAKWKYQFQSKDTTRQVFHAASGDRECMFMHEKANGLFYAGDNFAAVSKSFDGYVDADMIFILPDEGVSVESLLSDPQVLSLLGGSQEPPQYAFAVINMAVPKFDITSETELKESLCKLGVTDAFEQGVADFSAIAENAAGIYLSKVDHCVRVMIDEEGVKAAAFTIMPAVGAALPEKEVNFVLDRPFLFAIRTQDEIPLFVGIVENP